MTDRIDLIDAVEAVARLTYAESASVATPGHPTYGKSWDELTGAQQQEWKIGIAEPYVRAALPHIRSSIAALIEREAVSYHEAMCDGCGPWRVAARDCLMCENRFLDVDLIRGESG